MADATLQIMLFDGSRTLLPENTEMKVRVLNGNQQAVFDNWTTKPIVRLTVPVTDGPEDYYTVLASATGYLSAGFTPVIPKPGLLRTVYVMLLPSDGHFNFADAQWESLPTTLPDLAVFLSAGAPDAPSAKTRYENLLETPANQPSLACLLNITTAMRAIQLPRGNAFSYFRQLLWEGTSAAGDPVAPRQDRFFAYAHRDLITQVQNAAAQGAWAQEAAPGLLHHGATLSYKQVQFGEANVQLTFHEHEPINANVPAGEEWVFVEPDIDYYKDLTAHALLEVIPGFFTLTDPKGVYVLRWIAGHQANTPEFNPPYVII